MSVQEEIEELDKKIKRLDERILEIDIILFMLVGLPMILLILFLGLFFLGVIK